MCHVSVGHVIRELESNGIPTTSIYVRAFAHVVEELKVPRAVITPHPMGRPMGPPRDGDTHQEVLRQALALLEEPEGRIVEYPGPYRPPAPPGRAGRDATEPAS